MKNYFVSYEATINNKDSYIDNNIISSNDDELDTMEKIRTVEEIIRIKIQTSINAEEVKEGETVPEDFRSFCTSVRLITFKIV
jgi:hypothetical protein